MKPSGMRGRSIATLAVVLCLGAGASAQMAPDSYRLQTGRLDVEPPTQRLTSNVIIDIRGDSTDYSVWAGTGQGVSHYFRDQDRWESYGEAQGLGKGGTSALVVTDSIIWAAFAFDTSVGISGAGGGLAYSRDGGATWTKLPQPRDPRVDVDEHGYSEELGYWPTTTNVDNITYDIALSDSFIWTTSKGGGLRRHRWAADYTDYLDWEVVTPDTHKFHPVENLNHIAFAVVYAEGVLWVGTAGGINKSTDEGRTWTNYNHVSSGISGNFITAMMWQDYSHTLWVATWRAEGATEYYGVTKTTDGGMTWEVVLDDMRAMNVTGTSTTVRAHNFASDDSIVYVCDDAGLWKTPDGGSTWGLFPPMKDADEKRGAQFYEPTTYSALAFTGWLWVGGTEGIAYSADMGNTWHIFQAALPLSDPARPVDTYAYPNPFSPTRFSVVRFRYNNPSAGEVSVSIFDFSMTKVTDPVPGVQRPAGENYEVWDGRKNGTIVANGTYFYRIKKPGGEVWGKVVILD
jgi:photosystem II stability/assembly factor-like uncharacterized protein